MTTPQQRSSRAFNDVGELVDFILPGSLGGGRRPTNLAIEGAYNAAAYSLADVNTAQNIFDPAQDTIQLAAATRYRFLMLLDLDTGATSHTTGLLFALSGGLTLSRIKYWTSALSSAANTLGTPQFGQWEVATAAVVTAASTAASTQILAHGTIVTAVAGALTPQLIFSAAPGGSPNSVAADSFFEIWRVGAATDVALGNVA